MDVVLEGSCNGRVAVPGPPRPAARAWESAAQSQSAREHQAKQLNLAPAEASTRSEEAPNKGAVLRARGSRERDRIRLASWPEQGKWQQSDVFLSLPSDALLLLLCRLADSCPAVPFCPVVTHRCVLKKEQHHRDVWDQAAQEQQSNSELKPHPQSRIQAVRLAQPSRVKRNVLLLLAEPP